ncbi:MAG: hypothetical protein Q9M35_03535 [Rhodothermus sp.]|nr:hypothetical protein [Rhodothermus sp.]
MRASPSKLFALVAGGFLLIGLLLGAITVERFVSSAPETIHRYMRLSGYISVALTTTGTLVIYILTGIFTWGLGVFVNMEPSKISLTYACCWLIGLGGLFHIVSFIFANAYLFDHLALFRGEQLVYFLEKAMYQTHWYRWQQWLEAAFFITAPLTFGLSLYRKEKEHAGAKGILGAASTLFLLALLAFLRSALR